MLGETFKVLAVLMVFATGGLYFVKEKLLPRIVAADTPKSHSMSTVELSNEEISVAFETDRDLAAEYGWDRTWQDDGDPARLMRRMSDYHAILISESVRISRENKSLNSRQRLQLSERRLRSQDIIKPNIPDGI